MLDEELKMAAASEAVRTALENKVRREHIGHEIELMMMGNQPQKALKHVDDMSLFSTVFRVPQELEPDPPISENYARLPECRSARHSLSCRRARHSLSVMNRGSLQQTTSKRKSSASEGNRRRSSPSRLVLSYFGSDSWGFVEHFLEHFSDHVLELPRSSFPSIVYHAECEEFEKARKMAKMTIMDMSRSKKWRIEQHDCELPKKMVWDLFGGHLNIPVVHNLHIYCKSFCEIHEWSIRVTDE